MTWNLEVIDPFQHDKCSPFTPFIKHLQEAALKLHAYDICFNDDDDCRFGDEIQVHTMFDGSHTDLRGVNVDELMAAFKECGYEVTYESRLDLFYSIYTSYG